MGDYFNRDNNFIYILVGSGNINGGNGGSYDFLGFGTLLYQQDTISESCYPEGLTARVNGTKVDLNWWGPVYAINYSVGLIMKLNLSSDNFIK